MKKRCEKGFINCIFASLTTLLIISSFTFFIYKPLQPQITGMAITTLNEPEVIEVNFNQEIGVVRDDFYGVNTHGRYLTNESYVDITNDGILDTPSNQTWHMEKFISANMKIVRVDAYLYNTIIDDNSFRTETGMKFDNINMVKETVKFMAEKGLKTMIILDQTPKFVQNRSSPYCDSFDSYTTCPINNSKLYAQTIQNYLNYTTQGGKYADNVIIEVRNEPYANSWLNKLPIDHPIKGIEYVKLFNLTYHSIKSKYPNMTVCGPSGLRLYTNLTNAFISNSSKYNYSLECLTIHPYADNGNSYLLSDQLYKDVFDIISNCSYFGLECPHIIASEWGEIESELKNTTSRKEEYESSIAAAYSKILNNYPQNITLIYYQWSESYKYGNIKNYPEYPQKWSMVSEPALDNEINPPYNITKNFATYHPSGSIIVNSTPTNNTKVVASKKDKEHITLINKGENSTIKLKITGSSGNRLKDLETEETYTITNGETDIGELGEYEIRYFEIYKELVEQPTPPPSTGGGGGSYTPPKEEPNITKNQTIKITKKQQENTTKELPKETKKQEINYSGNVVGTGKAISEEISPLGKFLAFGILGLIIVVFIIVCYFVLTLKKKAICYYPKVYIIIS
jgi:hypothetical protein